MRKYLFTAVLCITCSLAFGQEDTLKQYLGKYRFPEGSAVTEINVIMDGGVLTATSVMGNSELKQTGPDTFEVVAFQGVATFKRNSAGKISGVTIVVGETTLEGTKSDNSFSQRSQRETQLFSQRQLRSAKAHYFVALRNFAA